jgi:hypothetical protein
MHDVMTGLGSWGEVMLSKGHQRWQLLDWDKQETSPPYQGSEMLLRVARCQEFFIQGHYHHILELDRKSSQRGGDVSDLGSSSTPTLEHYQNECMHAGAQTIPAHPLATRSSMSTAM